ncbi:MAG: type II/IV secretion system protein [Verrucomicrobia bacterium]|nr:type II/IV secretion system protein [Verrucomicrobiota bacterium]
MEPDPPKREVSDLLFERGLLSPEQLEDIRRRQRKWHVAPHTALVELNYASEEDTYRALAELHALEFVDLSGLALPADFKELVPVKVLMSHRFVPIGVEDGALVLAFCEPPRHAELGNLRLLLGRKFRSVLTSPSCFRAVIKQHFGLGAETIFSLHDDRSAADASAETVFSVPAGEGEAAVTAGIVRYVDQLLSDALRLQATDIHIEPYYAAVKLRYRIDGVLQTVPTPEGLRQVYASLVSRLKIMAGLNIAEKRMPHDGRITTRTETDEYDLRVSTIPTKHGEAVCLRILGRRSLALGLRDLGLEPAQEQLVQELTRLPQGLVLITGPTGSGKTTTLYAALAQANDEGRKIITIEDPVEYQLDGAVQIQTRDEIGLSFAAGLRAILRHDPDVVLIGEIRDAETAEIAVRAAQTGHLVFSTVHTNDSISAITRLLDMGVEPFLLGASLVCSVAQRLAQRICRHCARPDPDLPDSIRREMAAALHLAPAEVRAAKGAGCVECDGRGYRGRVALYEFFLMSDALADLLGPEVKTVQLRALARSQGWKPLREQGWQKVQAGLIPIAELERLTRRVGHTALEAEPGATAVSSRSGS